MELFSHPCPCCNSSQRIHPHTRYTTQTHGVRTIYHCRGCDIYYSETFATPIAGLTTPLSRIIEVLKARSEGMGLNATARTFRVSKKSVIDWERRLAALKTTLMLYALLHEFIHQEIEGDELYTKVNKNKPPSVSEGWTIMLKPLMHVSGDGMLPSDAKLTPMLNPEHTYNEPLTSTGWFITSFEFTSPLNLYLL